MMPLSMARMGEPVRIMKINGKDETKRFLNSLGFVIGDNVTVVSQLGGNMIINVKDTRVAIDKSMANRIMIDLRGEYQVEQLIKRYLDSYDAIGNFAYIDGDEDKIFDLFSEGLEAISSNAEIFATDQFKGFKIKPPASVRVGIKVSGDRSCVW